ncbi:hypothetical protein CDL12_05347 [Handroanthus impetiginosus]|uniref:Remorin C-terminal domain-containing protein n=1 Tax=Handroanthus impetiginosus TaxID=429701 RepID=A0A2G9HWN4_9LAMI|nr:hypothetical protein CDL12_05347 [Handroanthus impetiginosus]
MSWIDAEFAAAVAAAAYAIYTLEESKPRVWSETTFGPDKSMDKMRSKAKDTEILPEPSKTAPKFTDKTSQRSFKDPEIKMKSKPKDTGIVPEPHKSPPKFMDETSKQSFKDSDTKMPEKAPGPAPSIKKKTSFAEINETNSDKPDNQELEKAPERTPSVGRPPTFAHMHSDTKDSTMPTTPVETRRQNVRKPGPRDYVADAWTKEKMASIKERYERLRDTIDKWEAKKKTKANIKKERTEAKLEKRRAEAVGSGKIERIKAELEKKRAKAVKRYHSDIARIEEIAAGARAQAGENRRNEEFKVKEKANRIRLTGELPTKRCLCF